MLDEFYGPYAEKLWGVPATELKGDLARRRIANNAPGRIVAKLARAARGHQPKFRYPATGTDKSSKHWRIGLAPPGCSC